MKKLFAVILALCLMTGAACASESIAQYRLPVGAQVLPYYEMDGFAVPEGLEPMYGLMSRVNRRSNVYIARMKNGRALVSVSSTEMDKILSPEELLALWPDASRGVQAP